ncbi:hypothetical protein [Bacillus wiedmannii]|uniref:hypothetical protein n=1 Tax=Bacillus wiedmannii TaxID=1890302 RepID=UPI00159B91C9|nr:hypothetical protein [Bacillus wiedmannii]
MKVSLYYGQGNIVVTSPKKGTPFTVPVAIRVISPGPKAVTLVWKNPSASVNTVVGETVAASSIVKVTGNPATPIPFMWSVNCHSTLFFYNVSNAPIAPYEEKMRA